MGNPYAGLDEAGAGNVAMGAGLRPTTKGVDEPPNPKVHAPVLDPTEVAGDGKQDVISQAPSPDPTRRPGMSRDFQAKVRHRGAGNPSEGMNPGASGQSR